MTKKYITPEHKAKLEKQLAKLLANQEVISQEINERREEGDLKENAGYEEARLQQAKEKSEIERIQQELENCTTERPDVEEGVAYTGCVLQVYYDGDESDTETFLIGTSIGNTDDEPFEIYSEEAPLGAAVLGHREGETVEYQAPNGQSIKVTIVKAEPYDSEKHSKKED